MKTESPTMALQTTDASNRSSADIFFDIAPIVTDWNHERQLVRDGTIKSEDMLRLLKEYEPIQIGDPREHAHWIDQQRLRLALLHENSKLLEAESLCEFCASRQADPLFVTTWKSCCLHCAERDRQRPTHGSRGSCDYLQPIYNPRSHSWGLLYYSSHGTSDDAFIFWLADFFKSRVDAEEALAPIHYYVQWLERKYKGMQSHLDATDLLPMDDVINLSLPLDPEQFRELLRTKIEKGMNQEQEVLSYYVREAMEGHEREERD